MKRQLCVILTLIFLFGIIASPMQVGAADSDVTGELKLLSDLGIITDTSTDSGDVSRGEFTTYVTKALNILSMPSGYAMPFTDVASGHQYYTGIYNAYAFGFISDSETFRPNDTVTSTEAIKMVVAALGYNFLAEASGGWPTGYLAAGSKLGLLDAVDTASFTRTDAYELLYNMLHCEMPGVTITDTEYQYSVKEYADLLYERWNISSFSGTVEDAQYFGINYDNGVGEGKVGIDGYVLKNGGFDTDALFGEKVDVYYDYDTNTVRSIYSYDADSKNITKIFSTQEMSYSNNTYSYTDEKTEETETVSISKNAAIIYNGKKVTFDSSLMVPDRGYVKVIKGTSSVDIVIIRSYKEILVSSTVASELLVADKLESGNVYEFDEENTTYYDQNGAATYFISIVENDILWVAQSSDKTMTEVVVCRDSIGGTLSGTGGDTSVYIDGRKYNITDSAKEQLNGNLTLGGLVRGYINPDGNIIWIEADSGSNEQLVGYLMYSALFVNGMDSSIKLRVFGDDGIVHEYTMAKTFSVNGVSFNKSAKENYERLPKEADVPTSMAMGIILYSANKDNEVTNINYADDVELGLSGAKNLGLFKTFTVDDDTDNYIQYRAHNLALMGKGYSPIFVERSMVRFVVPVAKDALSAEDDDYKLQALADTNYYKLQAHTGYSTSEDNMIAKYIVSKYQLSNASDSVGVTNSLYLVNSISQVINNEGDEVERLSVYGSTGAANSFYSEQMGYFSKLNLKFGDLVKLETDAKSRVTGVTVIYRSGENKLSNVSDLPSTGFSELYNGTGLTENQGMGALADSLILVGSLYQKSSTAIRWLPANWNIADYDPDTSDATCHGISLYNANIVVCDMKSETVTQGDAASLKSYLDYGGECSFGVIETGLGVTRALYIYEN